MTAPTSARRKPGFGAIAASYQLGLSAVLTRGRIIGSAVLVGVILLQFSAISSSDVNDASSVTSIFFAIVIGLLIPVFTVSTASNVVGAAVSDSTLVYPWLRPVARWQLALGHIGSALTLTLPVALLSGAGAAALVVRNFEDFDGQFVLHATVIAGLTALAYTPIVTALGVRFKRASTFAFVYIFLLEQLFARNSTGVGRLAIQTYIRSIFFSLSGGEPTAGLGTVVSPGVAWVALALIVALGTALTALFLKRADVA